MQVGCIQLGICILCKSALVIMAWPSFDSALSIKRRTKSSGRGYICACRNCPFFHCRFQNTNNHWGLNNNNTIWSLQNEASTNKFPASTLPSTQFYFTFFAIYETFFNCDPIVLFWQDLSSISYIKWILLI